MVWLDTVYARLVPEETAAFSEVADFLLLIGAVTFLAAVGAIAFSWNSGTARYYFIASFVILLLEFFGPVFFAQLIESMQGSGFGTTLRIIGTGMASILAWIGLHKFYRHTFK